MKGTCDKGKDCKYWHPPVCSFWKKGSCSTKGCSFLHMDKPSKALKSGEAAPAVTDAKAKVKAGEKPKAVMAIMMPFSIKVTNDFDPIADVPTKENLGRDAENTSKKVKFAKKDHQIAARHIKHPSYLKYFPYKEMPPVTKFMSSEESEHYNAWYRKEAFKLHKELHPEVSLEEEAFFSSNESTPSKVSGEPSPEDQKNSAPRILKPTNPTAMISKVPIGDTTRSYIVDSGASFHLASKDTLLPKERKSIEDLEEPITVQTANGDVTISQKCRVHVKELDLWIWAHLLPCTVAVLSLGALCSENGYTYVWKPGQSPALIKGRFKIQCVPRNNVPFIYAAKGNLHPSSSNEDAVVEDILDELAEDEDFTVVRRTRKQKYCR